jgi:hypothetical protein
VSDTVDSVFRWGSSGILRHSTGSALVVNGTGNGGIFIANSGTMATTPGAWILHGDDSISIKKNLIILSLDAADSSKTTNYVTATAALSIAGTAVNPLRLHGGAFNLYGNNNLTINSTASGSLISYSAGSTFGGTITGNIRIYPNAASKAITVPSITVTAGIFLAQMQYAGNSDTIGLAGNLNITGTIGIGGRTTNTGHQFNSNGYSITASKALTIDAATGVSTGSFAAAFSNSAVACSVFTHTGPTGAGAQTITFGSSAWTVKDAFTLASAGTGTVTTSWSEGGSLTFITNTGNKTLTSNGHAFQDMIINCSGQKVTQQDSGQYVRWIKRNGRWSCGGNNMQITRTFLDSSLSNIDTTTLACQITLTGANDTVFLHWKDTTGVTNIAASTWNPQGNCVWNMDSHKRTISRLICASGKTYTFHPPDSTAIKNWTSGNWSGATWQSSTPGTYYYDSLPASTTPAALDVQDCYNYGQASAPDTTCINRGHNRGFTWHKARIDSVNKSTGPAAGGDTARIRGKYFVWDGAAHVRVGSAQASYVTRNDSLLQFIVPAGTGTQNIYVATSDSAYGGDSALDTVVNGWTYSGGGTPPTITGRVISDTIGNAGIYGHVKGGGAADSTKMISTWPDSAAMKSYTTKDSVAYRWKTKKTKAGYTIRAYGASDSATAYDTLTIIGPSVSYASSPIIDSTATAATAQDPASIAMADSVTAAALPAGLSIAKTGVNMGRVSGTPLDTASKAGYKIVIWRRGFRADSTWDTITVVRGRPILTYPSLSLSVNVAYTLTPTEASGALDSVKVTSGTLPAGLSMTKATGVISGTPTTAGSANVTATAWNVSGSRTHTLNFTITTGKKKQTTGFAKGSFSNPAFSGQAFR